MQPSACFFRVWELIRGFSSLCAVAKPPLSLFQAILVFLVFPDPYYLSVQPLPMPSDSAGFVFLFWGRPSVCSSRFARNLTSTEYWDFKIGWQACSSTPTFPADLTQQFPIHLGHRVRAFCQGWPVTVRVQHHGVHSGE